MHQLRGGLPVAFAGCRHDGCPQTTKNRPRKSQPVHMALAAQRSFSDLFNVAASRPAKSPRDKCPLDPRPACVNREPIAKPRGRSTEWAAWQFWQSFRIARSAALFDSRRARCRAAARRTTRCSRRASTCRLGERPGACAPASCPARPQRRRQARPAEAARDRPGATARCWKPAASTSCRCSKAWSCRPTSRPRPIPKSSTGRLDIFTRVMTDHGQEFDKIPAGYAGPLYHRSQPAHLPDHRAHRLAPVADPLPRRAMRCCRRPSCTSCIAPRRWSPPSTPNISGGGIALSIDLSGDADRLVGYRGKHHTGLVDVDKRAAHDVLDFWEPLYNHGPRRRRTRARPRRILHPGQREAVHVPPLYAAEMTPFDPLVGEFRVHYAGFFDPGFGHSLGRRHRQPRRARSAQPRGAVHPRARPDRRPAGLRAHAARGRRRSTAPTSAPTIRRRG